MTTILSNNRILLGFFGFLTTLFLILFGGSAQSQTALSEPARAPIINDNLFAGGNWMEEFYPYTNALPITLSARIGENVQQAQVDAVVPLLRGPHGGNVSALISHNQDFDYNGLSSVGLGFGFLFEDLAAGRIRLHGDFMESPMGNDIRQFSMGFDLFSKFGFDFHGNFYLPGNDQYLVDQFSSTSRMTQNFGGTTFGDPFAQGNQILQPQFDTFGSTTTTTTVHSELREQARKGGDIRMSFDIPYSCNFVSMKGIMGAYRYDSVFKQGDLTGVMAGLHAYPLRGVAIGAEYYEDEEIFGDNWMFTGGVSVPLDFDNVFNPREWGKAIRTAFSQRPRPCQESYNREYLESKLYAPATRNPRVVATVSDPILTKVNSRSRTRERTVDSEKMIADDVIFVNNGGAVGNGIMAGSGAGDGTAENPVDTIQGGATTLVSTLGGAGTVYVQGGTPYDSAADARIEVGYGDGDGVTAVTFVSSFKGVAACGGRTFGGDTARALVADGGFDIIGGPGGTTSFAEVSGFEIAGGFGALFNRGISAINVETFIVNCNFIHDVGTGIYHSNDDVTRATTLIFENEVKDTGADGILVSHHGDVERFDVAIRDNVVSATGGYGLSWLGIGRGISVRGVSDGGSGAITVSGNHVSDTDFRGITVNAKAYNGGSIGMTVAGNVVVDTENDGINVDAEVDDGGLIDATIANNTVSNAGNDGIEFDIDASDTGSTVNGLVRSNIITGSSDNGLEISDFEVDGGAISSLSIVGNQFLNSGDDGFYLVTDFDDFEVSINIANNTASNNGDEGFHLYFNVDDPNANFPVTITGNTFLDNGDSSIFLDSDVDDGSIIFSGTGNVSSGAGSGLSFESDDTSKTSGSIIIDGNTISFPNAGDQAE